MKKVCRNQIRLYICVTKANNMTNEVTLNAKTIEVGDVLIYVDNANAQRWTVTDVFEGGFEANDGYETKDFFFNELQIGWSISEKTKNTKKVERRVNYL